MKSFLIYLLLFFCITSLKAQTAFVKQWDYRYGGDEVDMLTAAIKTSDGGFIMGGRSYSDIAGDKTQPKAGLYDYWIVKTDSLGHKQWDKDFGTADNDWLYSVQQTADGGYILGGSTTSVINPDSSQPSYGQEDFWIIKTDSLGNEQWDKRYGGSDADELYSLQQTSDGGYILGGRSSSGNTGVKSQPNKGSYDYWVIKIDSIGTIIWDKDFGGTGFDQLNSVKQTPDGGYLLAGTSSSDSSFDKTQHNVDTTLITTDYWVIKIDALGNKIWDKTFGGKKSEFCYVVETTNDNGFILGGESNSPTSITKSQPAHNGTNDYWIIKCDSIGTIQWNKDFGGYDIEELNGSITQTIDNGYLISGSSYSNSPAGEKSEGNIGQEQGWVIKTDGAGNKLWDKTIFTPGHCETIIGMETDSLNYVFAIADDGVVGGYKSQPAWTTTSGTNSVDFWIIKLSQTSATTAISSVDVNDAITVSPNPCLNELTISGLINMDSKVSVRNLQGQLLYEKRLFTEENTLMINTFGFSEGMYLLQIERGAKLISKKVIIYHGLK